MTKTYFISDLHFSHELMLKIYPKTRNFKSVKEMNEYLISLWNDTIKPDDIVYNLGDFAFANDDETERILKRLNGKHHLIFGNHDKRLKSPKFDAYFASRQEYLYIKNKPNLVLFHYPIFEWDGFFRGNIHLHGHMHDKALLLPRAFNVAYDFNARFLELDEIKSLAKNS